MNNQYVDGFVLPIPRTSLDAYKAMSEKAAVVWRDHGALDYRECVADDMNIEGMVSFNTIAGASEEEIVIFAWITYPSREDRDHINAAVMQDPRLECDPNNMPFDCSRMAYGGFKTLVSIAP